MTFGLQCDEPTSASILDRAAEGGIDFIDSSDVYPLGGDLATVGRTEEILGRWLHGRRDRFVLATKCFGRTGPSPFDGGNSRKHIFDAVDASLRRLQTDYIDLYQAHKDDPETPLAETLGAFTELIRQGKVRAIGASNYSGARLAESLEVSQQKGLASYRTLQPEYNLYDRFAYESDLEPVCQKYGLGGIPYFSLASGFLTGKYSSEADLSKSQRGQMVKKYLNLRGFRILDALDQVAKRHNATPTQVALAYLMARPGITAPIASATNLQQLDELVKAASLMLDQASIDLLNQASAQDSENESRPSVAAD
jgi:aryl-alcohol dehydrogenase-like predicted oxidoreductase